MRKLSEEEVAILATALTLADAITEFGHDSVAANAARAILERFALVYRESRLKKARS
jgi:hypothetical protein